VVSTTDSLPGLLLRRRLERLPFRPMRNRPRSLALAVLLATAGAVGLASCSSSSTTPQGVASVSYNTGSGPSASSNSDVQSPAVASIPAAAVSAAGTWGTAPTVTVPSGPPPTTLQSADLIVGKGPIAQSSDKVTVQYVLATYSSHKEVQSSWTSQPFTFTLGSGQVIPGWDQGVLGMKVGGRRELIIPADLAYKSRSPGPGIASNDTLVFVIDLTMVN